MVIDMINRHKVLNKSYKLTKENIIPNRYYKKLAKQYDKMGYLDVNIGRELSLLFNEDYAVGIHRTGYSRADSNYLYDVFYNGLINNGDLMQGVAQNDYISIGKTVSIYSNPIIAVGQIKSACRYKDSDGVIIVRIPKSYIGLKNGEIKPIYYKENNGNTRLLPEYIYGFLPVMNGNVGRLIRNPNYTNTHDYENDGVYYESDVLDKVNLDIRRR